MTEIIDRADARAMRVEDALFTHNDAYINDLIRMGGTKDPNAYTTARSRGLGLSDASLSAMYVEDPLAARIVDLVVRDALRTGWSIKLPGSPQEAARQRKAYLDLEVELGVWRALSEGARWGRVYGGAVTWIGVDDGKGTGTFLERQREPIDLESFQGIRFLHTFDRREVMRETSFHDPTSREYRRTATFKITPSFSGPRAYEASQIWREGLEGGVVVHESRIITWPGAPTDARRQSERMGWDDSVLERAWEKLRTMAQDESSKSHLLNRISQFVIKLKNLGAMIVGNQERLNKRLSLIAGHLLQGLSVVMDTEEAVEQVTQPIAGIEAVVASTLERVALAGEIPPSVFAGKPTEAEQRAWDEYVEAWRREVLLPRHEAIAKLILRSAKGPTAGSEPETWDIVYRPLHEPTPTERATLRKLQSEVDANEIDKGVLPPEAVALHRHTNLSSGEGEVPLDEAEVAAALERRRELAKQPPKDNAELGTVGARMAAVRETVKDVVQRQIPRESGIAILVQFARLTPEDAAEALGPETFVPAPPPNAKPGPAPDPANGEGAGAPQGLAGFDDGGNPKGKALPPRGSP
jgi:phage-related protein (TIGR01555 family)